MCGRPARHSPLLSRFSSGGGMGGRRRHCEVGRVWAYAYLIVPPQSKRCLDTIRDALDHAHAEAKTEARIWAGRLVLERLATRILIVSDSPDQGRGVDHTLAAEVRRLQATFTRSESMEIPAEVEPTNHFVRRRHGA
jgi:hypothetical protein